MMTSKPACFGLMLAAALALLGVGISAVLLQHHIVIEVGGNPLLSSVCEAGERASCDAVLASEWGHVRGVPTAMWGLFYFAAMASWIIVVGRPSGSRRWLHLLVVVGSAAGAGIAGGLAYLMYTQMPQWCRLCAATHVIAGLLFILVLLLWPRKPAVAQPPSAGPHGGEPLDAIALPIEPAGPPLRLVLAALLLAAAGSGFAWSEYNRRLEIAQGAEYLARWQEYESDWHSVYNLYLAQPQVQIPILPEDSIRGSADAPYTVVMFADLQCRHCRELDRILREKLEKYPEHFRLIFKHFPMNRRCNNRLQGQTNPAACAAAATAEAAYVLGGDEAFWAMHDALFENPAALASSKALEEYTREVCERIGIDYEDLKAQFTTLSVWSRVNRHVEQAGGAGVQSTPTVFLDDRRVTGWVNTKFWDYLVYLEQQKQAAGRRGSVSPPAPPPATQPRQAPENG